MTYSKPHGHLPCGFARVAIMEQILERLFESVPKVKILRLFVRNQELLFTFEDIKKRSQVRPQAARSELKKLIKLDLISQKISPIKYQIKRRSGKIINKSRKTRVFFINKSFRLLPELHDLVAKDSIASRKKLLAKIRGLGSMKLVVLSGIFLNSDRARTDLLLVGNNIKKGKLERFLADVESEIGRPLQYTLMEEKEFKYRLDMYDRFLRDILEYPHDKLINRLKI